MKKIIMSCMLFVAGTGAWAQLGKVGGMLKNKVNNKIQNEENRQIDKGVNKAGEKAEDAVTKKNKNADTTTATNGNVQNSGNTTEPVQPAPVATAESPDNKIQPLKVYQNYDFIPGDKIIFEDNFTDDQDGEFASHWKLKSGQAVVNTVQGKPSFLLTDGNYAEVAPRIKTENYLGESFTLEFDFIYAKGADDGYSYHPMTRFFYMGPEGFETTFDVYFGTSEVGIGEFNKAYPAELREGFENKWHHAAIVLKNGQMKTYVDQYRVCVNPNVDMKFNRAAFDGIGSETNPIVFTNVKIAEGGGMNLIGKKFTDAKIVTRGITFDVNKASIKPESMGTLNMIVKVMTENPDLKFEVDGHTDADGDDAANMKLSQLRAEAVKIQLVNMGINAVRLTAKGFGESKPVSDNTSPEGKANNRRVEFIKQ